MSRPASGGCAARLVKVATVQHIRFPVPVGPQRISMSSTDILSLRPGDGTDSGAVARTCERLG
jgi:hypothetical protein